MTLDLEGEQCYLVVWPTEPNEIDVGRSDRIQNPPLLLGVVAERLAKSSEPRDES